NKCSVITDKAGTVLNDHADIASRWKEYIEILYKDDDLGEIEVLEKEGEVVEENLGFTIMREEFEMALKKLKNNKATGFDDLRAELLKESGPLM
ncbi:hypothetical protein J437_LFUL019723, partial [Ladona fulva]